MEERRVAAVCAAGPSARKRLLTTRTTVDLEFHPSRSRLPCAQITTSSCPSNWTALSTFAISSRYG